MNGFIFGKLYVCARTFFLGVCYAQWDWVAFYLSEHERKEKLSSVHENEWNKRTWQWWCVGVGSRDVHGS